VVVLETLAVKALLRLADWAAAVMALIQHQELLVQRIPVVVVAVAHKAQTELMAALAL
jgi:uncharacterized membrane protein